MEAKEIGQSSGGSNNHDDGAASDAGSVSPLIVALDYAHADDALAMADRLDATRVRLKVGKELFVRVGPSILAALATRGFEVFLDLKFHDIPNTVAGAVSAACDHGVWMVNVHVSGGPAMLTAARAAVDAAGTGTLLTGVTVLTSMDAAALASVGVFRTAEVQVLELAKLAFEHGLDGVVCSAQELACLASAVSPAFLKVTPGIRPFGSDADDQRRAATPAAAIRAGATHLVVGRPITRAPDPAAVATAVLAEITGR